MQRKGLRSWYAHSVIDMLGLLANGLTTVQDR
jgi:hypothetical protein